MPIIKNPTPNPISGMIIPNKESNLIFIINITPTAKYAIPKNNIGNELGSEGVLNMGRMCKIPVSNNRQAAR
jgi:hypothetical protein